MESDDEVDITGDAVVADQDETADWGSAEHPSGLVPDQEKSLEIHSPEYKRSKKEEEDVNIPEESGASSSSAYQPPPEEIAPQLPID